MQNDSESKFLNLIQLVPNSKLNDWLSEFYGKKVHILKSQTLRHRDFSYVARLFIENSLPESIIFKAVLPPWNIEQDIYERILVPSISYCPQIYLTGNYNNQTVFLIEDLGQTDIREIANENIAITLGENLAKLHRSYQYRVEEINELKILFKLTNDNIEQFMTQNLVKVQNYSMSKYSIAKLSKLLSMCDEFKKILNDEPISIIHGDLYSENVILNNNKLYFIDWSWFVSLSYSILDLVTITANSPKNGKLSQFNQQLIESYSFESGRNLESLKFRIKAGMVIQKMLFLKWLLLRKDMGIEGTTVGPVNSLIETTIDQIELNINEPI